MIDRRELLLWVGIAAGTAAMLAGVAARRSAPALDEPGVAALVNGTPIESDRFYRSLLAARGADGALSGSLRKKVLERLVSEELLLARAIELGLARSEPMARQHLLTAAFELARGAVPPADPSDEELESFLGAHPELSEGRRLYRVRDLFFRDDDRTSGESKARAALETLEAGGHFSALEVPGADRSPSSVPDTALPPATLRNYLGPTAAREVTRLAANEIAGPIAVSGGARLVQLVERVDPGPRPLAPIRGSIRELWLRERQGERLSAYLGELRASARIEVNPSLLDERSAVPPRFLEEAATPSAEGTR